MYVTCYGIDSACRCGHVLVMKVFFKFQYRVTLLSLGLSITIDTIKRHNQVIIIFINIITK